MTSLGKNPYFMIFLLVNAINIPVLLDELLLHSDTKTISENYLFPTKLPDMLHLFGIRFVTLLIGLYSNYMFLIMDFNTSNQFMIS